MIHQGGGRVRAVSVVVLLLLLAVAVTRSPFILLHGRFWAEEGAVHFRHAFSDSSPTNMLFVYKNSGYVDLFCNAATWVAARGPLVDAPLVTAWLSFGVLAALLWMTLFWPSELLPTPFARISAGVLLVVGTLAVAEVWLNALEAQTYWALLAILLLFVPLSKLSRGQFLVGTGFLAMAALSGVYADALAPLFVVRALQQRTRRHIVQAAVLCTSALLQFAIAFALRTSGDVSSKKLVFRGAGSVARATAGWHVAGFLFGQQNARTLIDHTRSKLGLLVLCVFAVGVLVFIATLLAHTPNARITLLLGGALLLEEVLVNYGAGNIAGGRFAVVPIGILTLMMVHGAATARPRWLARAGAVLCGIVFAFGLSGFWTYQATTLRCINCPRWDTQVRQWRAGQTDRLAIWPYPAWFITLQHRGSRTARVDAPAMRPAAIRKIAPWPQLHPHLRRIPTP